MVNVWSSPSFTVTSPDGDMLPCALAVAVIVHWVEDKSVLYAASRLTLGFVMAIFPSVMESPVEVSLLLTSEGARNEPLRAFAAL